VKCFLNQHIARLPNVMRNLRKRKMKHYFVILILTILFSCSSSKTENENSNNTSDTILNKSSVNYSLDEQPAKTIIDFLKWYRENQGIQSNLVNNSDSKTWDSTKFFSVNFAATEKYLSDLHATGFISEKYINEWRIYFKKCDKDFKDNLYNEPPIEGFDYDFIMQSQETEEDLKNLENSKVVYSNVSGDTSTVKINFVNGNKLLYKLTRHSDKWLIDHIERHWDN